MLLRIREDLDGNPEPSPWIDAARTLSERLITSDDTFYYFVELFTECVIEAAMSSDAELTRLHAEMAAIERAHGLREDQYWRTNEAPDEWRALSEEWERHAERIVGAFLREHGHADVAALRAESSAEYERRADKGYTDLWGDSEEDDGGN